MLKTSLKKLLFRGWHSLKNQNSINDRYIVTSPSPQNALDLFKGEWASRLPSPLEDSQAGTANLFSDDRIKWLISEVELRDRRVLELGPLEGGHSYMLDRCGVESVMAVESNTRAYLKCLVAKELLDMPRVRFLCGDFVQYLKAPDCPNFDLGIASGVLYHMTNPVELISLLSKRCGRSLFLWTHYYDEAWVRAGKQEDRFSSSETAIEDGFSHTLYRHHYRNANARQGFCGGSRPYSNWMAREEILKCLGHFGLPDIKIAFEDYNHPNGPSFALIASRG